MEWDEKAWRSLYNNPPLEFICEGELIKFDRAYLQHELTGIRDLVYSKFDNIRVFYGGEGRGKSYCNLQVAYVRYCLLKQLKIINYDWVIEDILYFNLKDLLAGLYKFIREPYRIMILDEADELKKKYWYVKEVKDFHSYLRRGRKFGKDISLNLPNLLDLPDDIILFRTTDLYQIELGLNLETHNFIRGNFSLFQVPRAQHLYSYYWGKVLNGHNTRETMAKIYKKAQASIEFPPRLIVIKGTFNNIIPFSQKEYEEMAIERTAHQLQATSQFTLSPTKQTTLLKVFNEFSRTTDIKKFFNIASHKTLFYRMKKELEELAINEEHHQI